MRNRHVKMIFWTLFVAMAGLVLTRVVDHSDGAAGDGDYYGEGRKRISISFFWLFSNFRKMELSSKMASIADDERFFIEECAEDE